MLELGIYEEEINSRLKSAWRKISAHDGNMHKAIQDCEWCLSAVSGKNDFMRGYWLDVLDILFVGLNDASKLERPRLGLSDQMMGSLYGKWSVLQMIDSHPRILNRMVGQGSVRLDDIASEHLKGRIDNINKMESEWE